LRKYPRFKQGQFLLSSRTHSGCPLYISRYNRPSYLWRPATLPDAGRLRAPIKFRKIRPLKDSFRLLSSVDSPFYGITNSDLSSYSKVFRLKNYLNGRANSLVRYHKYLTRHSSVVSECFAGDYVRLMGEVDSLRALALRLDNNSVVLHTSSVYKEVYDLAKSYPRRFEDHCLKLFGFYEKPRPRNAQRFCEESIYMQYLEKNSKLGRKSEIISRLMLEAKERKDWFFLFNTLTVRPGAEDKVFAKGSKAWSNYVVDLDRYFGAAAFGSVRKAQAARRRGDEYHLYFAVVEHGTLTGRLHIHVLHMFKALPKDFSDPNLGRMIPYRREIDSMRRFWKYGENVTPIAVRFNPDDAYGRKGWKWPLDENKSDPLTISDGSAIINYVAKYLNKSYIIEQSPSIYYRTLQGERSQCPTTQKNRMWRTRISRNLGKAPLRPLVSQITAIQTRQVLLRRQIPKIYGIKLPRMMIRRMLLSRYLPRLIRLAKRALMRYHAILASPLTPVERLRDLIARLRQFNPANFGSIKIRDSLGMVAYKKLEDMIRERFTPTGYRVSGLAGAHFKIC